MERFLAVEGSTSSSSSCRGATSGSGHPRPVVHREHPSVPAAASNGTSSTLPQPKASAKRKTPRRVSRLKLPKIPKKVTDPDVAVASELFRKRSCTDPTFSSSSSSLRDRLNERRLAHRQLTIRQAQQRQADGVTRSVSGVRLQQRLSSTGSLNPPTTLTGGSVPTQQTGLALDPSAVEVSCELGGDSVQIPGGEGTGADSSYAAAVDTERKPKSVPVISAKQVSRSQSRRQRRHDANNNTLASTPVSSASDENQRAAPSLKAHGEQMTDFFPRTGTAPVSGATTAGRHPARRAGGGYVSRPHWGITFDKDGFRVEDDDEDDDDDKDENDDENDDLENDDNLDDDENLDDYDDRLEDHIYDDDLDDDSNDDADFGSDRGLVFQGNTANPWKRHKKKSKDLEIPGNSEGLPRSGSISAHRNTAGLPIALTTGGGRSRDGATPQVSPIFQPSLRSSSSHPMNVHSDQAAVSTMTESSALDEGGVVRSPDAVAARADARAMRAAAAEKRASAARTEAEAGSVKVEATAETSLVTVDEGISPTRAPDTAALGTGDSSAPAPASSPIPAEAVSANEPPAGAALETAETIQAVSTVEAADASAAENPSVDSTAHSPWPCRRRHGMASLSLAQRRRTGGRIVGGAGSAGNTGKDVFRRQVLSGMFRKGLNPMRLRMGRVTGSRTGAGVVRGNPEGHGGPSRREEGVSCLAFDSMGALLAAGGMESVTVYDFDEYVPQVPQVKSTLEGGVRAYLQPTHCIQTRRAVSCLRWNPADEDQLAVSFRHYDEIDLFDLRTIRPNTEAIPVLTLISATSGGTGGASRGAIGRVRRGTVDGRGAGFRGVGASGAAMVASRASVRSRGLGHLSFEFVQRGGSRGGRGVTHLVAGGREGTFRVWRIAAQCPSEVSPYLQVQLTSNPRAGTSFTARTPTRPAVTAVCCINRDVALVGTDSGTLIAYSLHPPNVKAFQSGKTPDRVAQWYLGSLSVWGGGTSGVKRSEVLPDGVAGTDSLRICWIRLSPDHGPGVIVCGLRDGGAVVFDTRSGRALGITSTRSATSGTNAGFCAAGGTDWGSAILSCSSASQELLLLSTSARAALDARRRDGGGHDSRLRPGPGWMLGEAGGGGFRVEESEGFDLCLPVEVERAIPGQNRVLLSRDARAYLCARTQLGLLRSRMVTSSVLIGGERYSLEAVNGDGTALVLDRHYTGPRVDGRRGESDRGHGRRLVAGPSSVSTPADGRSSSPSSSVVSPGHEDVAAGGFETDGNADSDQGQILSSAAGTTDGHNETAQRPDTAASTNRNRENSDGTEDRDIHARATEPNSLATDHHKNVHGSPQGDDLGTRGEGQPHGKEPLREDQDARMTSTDGGRVSMSGLQKNWDRAWRPGSVRIFAKLKAVFDGLGGGYGEGGPEQSPDLGATYAQKGSSLTGDELLGKGASGTGPSWASLQVIARAKLDLRATTIACHPRMNFILVGLSDGTIAVILPGGKPRGRRRTTAST